MINKITMFNKKNCSAKKYHEHTGSPLTFILKNIFCVIIKKDCLLDVFQKINQFFLVDIWTTCFYLFVEKIVIAPVFKLP